MASQGANIGALPNEILTVILTLFSTQDLITLASVSRRLRNVVARVLHRRLLQASSLPDNDLILECYHPSAKISTPYLSCKYMDTVVRDGPAFREDSPSLADLRRLYSVFRPVVAEENRRQRSRPQQPLPGLLVMPPEQDEETATEDVYLEDGEMFSQLCAVTNLVKEGPRRGLFISHVNISDGVVRLFRQWLANMAGHMAIGEEGEHLSDQDRILWVGPAKDVGIRFQVIPGPAERMPLISGPGDDPPVSYKLVYEELLVRSNRLLLAAERSAIQEVVHSGKAIVIASM